MGYCQCNFSRVYIDSFMSTRRSSSKEGKNVGSDQPSAGRPVPGQDSPSSMSPHSAGPELRPSRATIFVPFLRRRNCFVDSLRDFSQHRSSDRVVPAPARAHAALDGQISFGLLSILHRFRSASHSVPYRYARWRSMIGSVLNDDSECPGRGSRTPAVRAGPQLLVPVRSRRKRRRPARMNSD